MSTKQDVAELLNQGRTQKEVASELNLAKSTVSYHAKALGFGGKTAEQDPRRTCKYDWSSVQEYYDLGNSVRQCMKEFGFSVGSWDKAVVRGDVKPRSIKAELNSYLTSGSKKLSSSVKRRLIEEELLENKCSGCGLGPSWRNQPLTLHIDHVDGDPTNNQISNLRVLCPNCHQQTDTWGRKNRSEVQ